MAFRSLIERQVASALRTIGDLGETARLTNVTTSGYSYATKTVEEGSSLSTDITVVLTGTSRVGGDSSGIRGTVIANSQDATGIDQYDKLTLRGVEWSIVGYEDNGYITTIQITRES